MIWSSCSFFRPVRTSTSTPRSRKMATAAGESSSAISTRGMRGHLQEGGAPHLRSAAKFSYQAKSSRRGSGRGELGSDGGEGPVEPRRQRLQVGGVDGGPAPDPQARRGVAVAGGVEGGVFLLQHRGELLGEVR